MKFKAFNYYLTKGYLEYFTVVEIQLETQIRGIHALVGNTMIEGRYIVIGTCSMQLINAVVYSLSPRNHDAI